ncbi:hypothetical protein, partial [Oceanicola granulosus]|uniref:hypothetical protein n=1 Tax=Oceanicola granulosus TaxID=252302 RepID=UPI003CCAC195
MPRHGETHDTQSGKHHSCHQLVPSRQFCKNVEDPNRPDRAVNIAGNCMALLFHWLLRIATALVVLGIAAFALAYY